VTYLRMSGEPPMNVAASGKSGQEGQPATQNAAG